MPSAEAGRPPSTLCMPSGAARCPLCPPTMTASAVPPLCPVPANGGATIVAVYVERDPPPPTHRRHTYTHRCVQARMWVFFIIRFHFQRFSTYILPPQNKTTQHKTKIKERPTILMTNRKTHLNVTIFILGKIMSNTIIVNTYMPLL